MKHFCAVGQRQSARSEGNPNIMKKLAALCLVLIVGPVIFSQQLAEWHPSLTEDNKAATWEDTSTFMLNSLINKGANTAGIIGTDNNAHLFDTRAFEVPTKCLMTEQRVEYVSSGGKHGNFALTRVWTLDLSKVDPLTISVVGDTFWNRQMWNVMMTGTMQGNLASWKGIRRDHAYDRTRHGDALDPRVFETSCRPEEKYCTLETGEATSDMKRFEDEETAKRFARALMHAALLCGGTKTVSPF
jgi:hypothetical protein